MMHTRFGGYNGLTKKKTFPFPYQIAAFPRCPDRTGVIPMQ